MILLVITPLVSPAPGGGAIYTELLCEALASNGNFDRVIVLSERHPDAPDFEVRHGGFTVIHRVFPYRAGKIQFDPYKYFTYLLQLFQFLAVPLYVRRHNIDCVLLHSSLFYHSSLSRLIFRVAMKFSTCRWIADVRDPKFPASSVHLLSKFHSIIACSQKVRCQLASYSILSHKVQHVPIPARIDFGSLKSWQRIQDAHGLHDLSKKHYIFFMGGIIREKGFFHALSVVSLLRSALPDVVLVVAGKSRDQTGQVQRAIDCGLVKYLGPISNSDCIALSVYSLSVLCLSSSEGMPRSVLEPLMAGSRFLVARGLPEFDSYCPQNTVDPSNYSDIVQRLILFSSKSYFDKLCYDYSAHNPLSVADVTSSILKGCMHYQG